MTCEKQPPIISTTTPQQWQQKWRQPTTNQQLFCSRSSLYAPNRPQKGCWEHSASFCRVHPLWGRMHCRSQKAKLIEYVVPLLQMNVQMTADAVLGLALCLLAAVRSFVASLTCSSCWLLLVCDIAMSAQCTPLSCGCALIKHALCSPKPLWGLLGAQCIDVGQRFVGWLLLSSSLQSSFHSSFRWWWCCWPKRWHLVFSSPFFHF